MPEERKDPDLVPADEAARLLGTTQLNLMMHVKRGLLDGREIDDHWYITPESLDLLLEQGKTQVVQAKCHPSCGEGSGGCSCR